MKKSPSDHATAALLHLVKKGSLTTCKTTDSVGAHGNSGNKSVKKQLLRIGKSYKSQYTTIKNVENLFGSKALGIQVSHSEQNSTKSNNFADFLSFKKEICLFADRSSVPGSRLSSLLRSMQRSKSI